MAKTPQPRGRCIFCCSDKGLSKAHIFPDWMQKVIPAGFKATGHQVSRRDELGAPIVAKGRFDRPGDPLSRRVRVACIDCNSGWMNRIETAARPSISRLMQGDWPAFDEENRKALATWITLATILAEYADPDAATISPGAREQFCEFAEPLPNWQIWIGVYDGTAAPGTFWHFSCGATLDPADLANMRRINNIQTTTFTLGKALVLSFSNESPVNLPRLDLTPLGHLVELWPPGRGLERPRLSISDEVKYEIATVIAKFLPKLSSQPELGEKLSIPMPAADQGSSG